MAWNCPKRQIGPKPILLFCWWPPQGIWRGYFVVSKTPTLKCLISKSDSGAWCTWRVLQIWGSGTFPLLLFVCCPHQELWRSLTGTSSPPHPRQASLPRVSLVAYLAQLWTWNKSWSFKSAGITIPWAYLGEVKISPVPLWISIGVLSSISELNNILPSI